MEKLKEWEALERYDDMLNECSPKIEIGSLDFDPSKVLKECDPIAYKCGFNDWMDSEGIELE